MQERVEPRGLFTTRPRQRSKDAMEIYTDAVGVKQLFRTIVEEEIGGKLTRMIKVKQGPLKELARVIEKSELRPDDPGCSDVVCDIVRAMVECTSMKGVTAVLKRMLDLDDQGLIEIKRVKDRYVQSPSPGGWRDTMINFTIAAPGSCLRSGMATTYRF